MGLRAQRCRQGCTHLLLRPSRATALRCRLVRETPIDEQLQGEAITADVVSHEAVPPWGGHPGRHRRLPDLTGLVAGWAPPKPGTDLVGHRHQPREARTSTWYHPADCRGVETTGNPSLVQRMLDRRGVVRRGVVGRR